MICRYYSLFYTVFPTASISTQKIVFGKNRKMIVRWATKTFFCLSSLNNGKDTDQFWNSTDTFHSLKIDIWWLEPLILLIISLMKCVIIITLIENFSLNSYLANLLKIITKIVIFLYLIVYTSLQMSKYDTKLYNKKNWAKNYINVAQPYTTERQKK